VSYTVDALLMSLATGTKFGRYEIRSQIGAGGMGEVYLAQDTKLDRKVALKILPLKLAADRDRMRRFVQEAKAASALNHPNIITIHEIDETDSGHFIATEFIDGETLRQRMRNTSTKLAEVLDVATQIAGALAAAHVAGIVHRDIKPENVMLRGDGIVKVLDFGLAKLTERASPDSVDTEAATRTPTKTEPGMVMGTAIYMSPEQARGLPVDARTDIFSLGVLIYEMVAGRLPFEGSNTNEILASILSDNEPPPLARFAQDVPRELEHIVSKALRKDREERYQTVKDLLIDLKDLRRELELQAQLERSAPPELRGRPRSKYSSEAASAETIQTKAVPTGADESRTTSGVEYIITAIKQHKLAAVIATVVLALGIVGLAAYLHARNTEAAIDSIAVLPFVNQNNDPNMDYLSDGISESIINSLSQLPNLKVMSRNSVFHYKGKDMDAQTVAKELKVQALFTGRVAQRGDALSISVELINAQDNSQLWGQQYNRKVADVFVVQEEIAKEISEKLRLKLTSAEKRQLARRPTENLKALQYYMQARSIGNRRTREDLLTAISYCEKAIAEDRNYALAYAAMADAYSNLGLRGYIAPIEGQRKAEEAARKALALDENLAEAHVALGIVSTVFTPANFSLGDSELQRAIDLGPNSVTGHQYLGFSRLLQGRLDESLEEILKARELDPLSSIIAREVSLFYLLKRDYGRSLELLRQADELGPVFSTQWEAGIYIQNNLLNEALAELEKAKQERKNDPILIYSTGMVYAARRERAEALRVIKELEEMSGTSLSEAHWIAKIYAALNENELALTWLERGLAARAIGGFYKDEPVWDPIRSDQRFADLLRRMGIQP
jgi:serine/threonine-protein kinase